MATGTQVLANARNFPLGLTLGLALTLLVGCVGSPETGAPPDAGADALVNLGLGYLRKGRLPEARASLLRALSLDGRHAQAHNALGLVFQLEREPELAEAHFRRALARNPDFLAARNNYGAFLFAQQRYAEAAGQLAQTAENPYYNHRAQAYENLGVSYLRLGRLDEAEAAFRDALALDPAQPRALLELAQIEFAAGNYARAGAFLGRHRAAAPASAPGLWLAIRLAGRLGEDDREQVRMLQNLFPASPEYLRYLESVR